MTRTSTLAVVSVIALVGAPIVIMAACGGEEAVPPPNMPVPVTTVSGPAPSASESAAPKPEPPSPTTPSASSSAKRR
jgi:hypothetical protein